LVVKSNALASRQIKALESRLIKGEKALLSLQNRPGKKVEEMIASPVPEAHRAV